MHRCSFILFFPFFSHLAGRLPVSGGRAVVGLLDAGASFFSIFVPMAIMLAVMMTMTGATSLVTLKANEMSACVTIDSQSSRV